MHLWGDEDVDWQGIGDAAEFIGLGLKKWRVGVRDWKEKYGTVRVYCSFGLYHWEQLVRPGWVSYRWPKWTWKWQSFPRPFFRLINILVVPLHVWCYKRYYRKALEKWPHLKAEILDAADFPELLDKLK